ncbi:hypothetical protein BPAE_0212g00110 [Botrytis paeoniae]|uniref:Uncharacterized protein n=1 Tax=Botrytis paeoniae TaxID=278948 RepID=A0A4Z1FE33_9HELO|nr:hypothetical protein BPAE_0212g00110 [Botrytis paeoniae]
MASIGFNILDHVSHSICSQCTLKLLCDYPSITLDSQLDGKRHGYYPGSKKTPASPDTIGYHVATRFIDPNNHSTNSNIAGRVAQLHLHCIASPGPIPTAVSVYVQ